jgi:hypothetical protein
MPVGLVVYVHLVCVGFFWGGGFTRGRFFSKTSAGQNRRWPPGGHLCSILNLCSEQGILLNVNRLVQVTSSLST